MKRNSYIGNKSLLFLVALGIVFSNFAWSQCNGLPYNQYYYDYDGDGYGTSAVFSGTTNDNYGWGQQIGFWGNTMNFSPALNNLVSFNYSITNTAATSQCIFQFYSGGSVVATVEAYPQNGGTINTTYNFATPLFNITSVVVYSYWNPAYLNSLTFLAIPSSVTACAQPTGYAVSNTDCNDAIASVNPSMLDICNSVDDDCDGGIDNQLYFADLDGDGYGVVPNILTQGNSAVVVNDNEIIIVGNDPDFGEYLQGNVSFVVPQDATYTFNWSYSTTDESAEWDPAYYINNVSIPLSDDEGANNQSGSVSVAVTAGSTFGFSVVSVDGTEGGATLTITNFNAMSNVIGGVTVCQAPAGYVTNHSDCNDLLAALNPGAIEVCNSIDDDCDGQVDEGVINVYFEDNDGDGYGTLPGILTQENSSVVVSSNEIIINGSDTFLPYTGGEVQSEISFVVPQNATYSFDWSYTTTDQSPDYDPAYYINNVLVPLSNNFGLNTQNGSVTVAVAAGSTFGFAVVSTDGIAGSGTLTITNFSGMSNLSQGILACSAPGGGYVTNNDDCNDSRNNIHPGVTELCNSFDDDCDGQIDQGLNTYYADNDGDGFGAGPVTITCEQEVGFVLNNNDCNDNSFAIKPTASELCNSVDDDCDGVTDDGLLPQLTSATSCGPYVWSQNNTTYNTTGTYYANLPSATNYNSYASFASASNSAGYQISETEDFNEFSEYSTSASGNFGAGFPSWTASAVTGFYSYSINGSVAFGGNQFASPLTFNFSPGVTGVGGNFFVVNVWGGLMNHTINFSLSDGTTHSIVVNSYNSFTGFLTNGLLITSLTVNTPWTSVNNPYVKVDNLLVTTGTAPGLTCSAKVLELVVNTPVSYYADLDSDGYGAGTVSNVCTQPSGYVTSNSDCNNTNASINPGIVEICNSVDDDCDSQVDEELSAQISNIESCGPYTWSENNTTYNSSGTYYVNPPTSTSYNSYASFAAASNNVGYQLSGSEGFDGYWGLWASASGNFGPGFPSWTASAISGFYSIYINGSVALTSNEFASPVTFNFSSGVTGVGGNFCVTTVLGALINHTINFTLSDGTTHSVVVNSYNAFTGFITNGALITSITVNTPWIPGGNPYVRIDNLVVTTGTPPALPCSSKVLNLTVNTPISYYSDLDNDGYGAGVATSACSPSLGYVSNNTDCNNNDPTIYPGAVEVCNGIDDNCDLITDNSMSYPDNDGDGYGDANSSGVLVCLAPNDYVSNNDDCNDALGSVFPGAEEVCNTLDDNCDAQIDEGVQNSYFADTDGDGFGAGLPTGACTAPVGFVSTNADCNNNNASVNPNAVEVCNTLDDNCDGEIDEGVQNAYYADLDEDGFGFGLPTMACAAPLGFVSNNTDCDDAEIFFYPGAPELCNNFDDDCDNQIDEIGALPNTLTVSSCGPYVWSENNTTYNTSGTYYANIPAASTFSSYGAFTAASNSAGYQISETEDFSEFSGYSTSASGNFGAGFPTWTASAVAGFYSSSINGSTAFSGNQFASPLTFNFSPGVTGVGGNFFVTNVFDGLMNHTINFSLSDGTTHSITVNSYDSFTGFISNGLLITSLTVNTPWISLNNPYVKVENLIVTTGTPLFPCGVEILDLEVNTPVSFYADLDGDGFGAGVPLNVCTQPIGYVTNNTDCSNNNAAVYPGATEVCNGIDDNCDAVVDEGLQSTFYYDDDNDGYGTSSVYSGSTTSNYGWGQQIGFWGNTMNFSPTLNNLVSFNYSITNTAATSQCIIQFFNGDTQVAAIEAYPQNGGTVNATYTFPTPLFGITSVKVFSYWNPAYLNSLTFNALPSSVMACTQPSGYAANNNDCNDYNANINPGEIDICNTMDDDCDSEVDNTLYYADADNDGYGDASSAGVLVCLAPSNYVLDNVDCNDANNMVYPSATEFCNSLDDDCDTQIDEGVQNSYYADTDGDGFGAGTATLACSVPNGFVTNNTDCNNTLAEVNPDAIEVCNNIDDDCNSQIDEGVQNSYYADTDGDGYGAGTATLACTAPTGFVATNTDCNDTNEAVYPLATEVCNSIDDDCNTQIDEGVQNSYYADLDGDGFGSGLATMACSAPSAMVGNNTDCDDASAAVYPGASESCNSIDDDCDGGVDEFGTTPTPQVVTSCGPYTWNQNNTTYNSSGTYYANIPSASTFNSLASFTTASTVGGYQISETEDFSEFWGNVTSASGSLGAGFPSWSAQGVNGFFASQVNGSTAFAANQNSSALTFNFSTGVTGVGGNFFVSDVFGNVISNTVDIALSDGTTQSLWIGSSDSFTGYISNGTPITSITINTPWISQTNPYVRVDNLVVLTGTPVIPCSASILQLTVNTPTSYYADLDGDGFGAGAATNVCSQPSGYVSNNTDCDDALASVNSGATEICNSNDDDCDTQIDEGVQNNYYVDTDGDGYGAGAATTACTAPAGYVSTNTDCNSTDASINPGATEVCNSIDDDCDTQVDEGVQNNYYVDTDGDGYGAGAATLACTAPTGFVATNTDCNDTNEAVYPLATEVCNSLDDDCDTQIDEGVQNNYYTDTDGDGYGAGAATAACTAPAGYVSTNTDCDNTNASINPGATEVCNSVDDDCDTQIDEGVQNNYYADTDDDGYGAGAATTACTAPFGYVSTNTDCNSTDASINPGATEVCNSIDEDCDTQIDEGVQNNYYADTDGDGYGAGAATTACTAPAGYVSTNTDCNSTDASINPGATEVCNSIDEDCDTQIDNGVLNTYYADIDGDGYAGGTTTFACSLPIGFFASNTDCNDNNASVNPSATEICNNIDDNCSGQSDEGFSLTAYYEDADGDGFGVSSGILTSGNATIVITQDGVVINGSNDITNDSDLQDVGGLFAFVVPNSTTYTFNWNYITNDEDGPEFDVAYYLNNDLIQLSDDDGGDVQSGTVSVNVTAGSIFGFAVVSDDNVLGGASLTITNFSGISDYNGGVLACTAPMGYVSNSTDCNDELASVNPVANEICNSADDDCDSQVDEGLVLLTYYLDDDGDGFGSGDATLSCIDIENYVLSNTDCDDDDENINPLAIEVCENAIDENCDGIDSPCSILGCTDAIACNYNSLANTSDGSCLYGSNFYIDTDGDGYGAGTATVACTAPIGMVANNADCNDNSSTVNPAAMEICNLTDDDCDTQIDEDLPLINYYLDVDGDAFGGALVASTCAVLTGNFVVVGGDCDDSNTAVHPGAVEICINSIDDDCDGIVNDGCLPDQLLGESPATSQYVWTNFFPTCVTQSHTLAGFTPSLSSQSICLTGEDKWHYFTATSEAVSIVVASSANDILLELQNASGSLIATENAVSGLGGEILNFSGLVSGQVYKVGVRNYNSALGIGSYTLCVKMLKRGGCDYGPGPYSLCQYFKASFAGAGAVYTFTFTGLTGNAAGNVYTRTQSSDICVLSNVSPSLPYGSTYNVSITATYNLLDAAGNSEIIAVPALSPCTMSTVAQPATSLRTADQCINGAKFRGAIVASLPWVCGVTNWRWEFTEVNPITLTTVGLPIALNRGAASNYINLGTVSALQHGKTYAVRTAPILASTGSNYQWGPTYYMCIIGSAGMVLEDNNATSQNIKTDIANEVNMSLYPNPTHGTDVNINLSGVESDNVQIRIVDAMGRQVWSNRFVVNGVLNTNITFEQPLSNGLYFVEAIFNGEVQTQRLMVQR